MNTIKQFLKNGIPFAISQHYSWLRVDPDIGYRIYELLHLKGEKIDAKKLNLDSEDLVEILNDKRIEKIMETDDGAIYDFQNFRSILTFAQRAEFLRRVEKEELLEKAK